MKLAHYTAIGNLEHIVKPDGLHFHLSRFSDMNEPHEIRWAEKVLSKIGLLEPAKNEDRYKVYPYVLSMSGNIDDMTMWRLFGNNGNGVCFVFDHDGIDRIKDTKHRSEGDDTPGCICHNVLYGDDDEILFKIRNMAEHLHSVGLFSNELLCTFLKPMDFYVENEYRYCHVNSQIVMRANPNEIYDTDEEDTKQINVKNTSRGLVRYVGKILPSSALEKIIVGWATSDNTVEIIKSFLDSLVCDECDYSHVEVVKSRFPLV